MEKLSLKKIAYLTAFFYTALIGAGMYTSLQINGVSYGEPQMVETLWYFEVLMTILVIFVGKKFFSWQELGFRKTKKKQAFWLVPIFVPIAVMGFEIINFISKNEVSTSQWKLFTLVSFTTLLVGFSEELMYRGILLAAFMKKNQLVSGVLVSSVYFSLLHSVNIFAGVPLNGMLVQLLATFIFGLFISLIRIKIKNIIPLIIFHWFWDFLLISNGVFGIEGGNITLYFILFEILFIIIMLPRLIIQEKRKKINKI